MAEKKTQVERQLEFLNKFNIDWEKETGDHYVLNCIFCQAESRMFINKYTMGWDCKRCGRSGGFFHLITYFFYEILTKNTNKEMLVKLANHRTLPLQAIEESGVTTFNDLYIFPAFGSKGLITDYSHAKLGEKLHSLDGSETGILNLTCLEKSYKDRPIFICEGAYDTLALKWLFSFLNQPKYVVGVPGTGTFKKEWLPIFSDRHVVVAYDKDEAGDKGINKVANTLQGFCRSLSYIKWPIEFPKKFDVNDFVSTYCVRSPNVAESYKFFESLVTEYKSIIAVPTSGKLDSVPIVDITPKKYEATRTVEIKEVIEEYRKVLDLNDNMIDMIKVCMATILSATITGSDPLWVFIVGPPGYGKTAVLSSFRDCNDHCYFQSNIKRNVLVSGFKGQNNYDPSLLARMNNKCLILKDFTEIMAMPMIERDGVFSILRGAFDGEVERDYGNDISRKYKVNFSLLAGVTNVIKASDQAALGERFLRFAIDTTEVDYYSQQRAAIQSAMLGEEDKVMLKDTLREFFAKPFDFSKERIKNFASPDFLNKLIPLARLIAHLRTQVPRFERGISMHNVIYEPEPESGNRLCIQLNKLAICLAVLEDKDKIDNDIYKVIKKVAVDSVAGYSFEIVRKLVQLKKSGNGLVTKNDLEGYLKISKTSLTNLLLDLEILKVIRQGEKKRSSKNILAIENTYEVTDYIYKLWTESEL